MMTTYRGIAIQVDNESLGDVPFNLFKEYFSEELEFFFPGAVIEIDCGTGARVEYYGINPNDEMIHECSEKAFNLAIKKLNN